jgi:hypothetical protein
MSKNNSRKNNTPEVNVAIVPAVVDESPEIIEADVIADGTDPIIEQADTTNETIVEDAKTDDSAAIGPVTVNPGDDLQAKIAEFKKLKDQLKATKDALKVAQEAQKLAADVAKKAGVSVSYTRTQAIVDVAKTLETGMTLTDIAKKASGLYDQKHPDTKKPNNIKETTGVAGWILSALIFAGDVTFDSGTKMYRWIPRVTAQEAQEVA